MRTHLAVTAFCLGLVSYADLASAQALPQAGQWELTTDMKGLPFGGGIKTGQACIKAETLAVGAEKALVHAAMAASQRSDSSNSKPPQCTFSDIQREGNGSKWKSSCTAPRGVMQGTGSGTLAEESAQITQSLEANLPFGKRTITQTITAKRIGACI
jgi:Protein of unknown function (DUF3617)